MILVFRPQAPILNSQAGVQTHGGGKILRFLTEIAVYLGTSAREAHGCYGTLIGSHMRTIER